MTFDEQHRNYLFACERAIGEAAQLYFQQGSAVSRAAEYSLLNGGKRVRGILTLATHAMLGGEAATASFFAAAIEMMHAFSLIHDDLPSIDNDDMRRGKPACHIVFGEANALLAGDLLAIAAFATLAGAPSAPPSIRNCAVEILAAAGGAKGMIYGQELDMLAEKEPVDEAGLRRIHQHKTGALILAGAQLGVVAAGQQASAHPAISLYAESIGTVFQIIDDILDVTADPQTLGKPVGSDGKNGKTTFASLYGVDKAKEMAAELTKLAVQALQTEYGNEAAYLCQFAQKLLERVY